MKGLLLFSTTAPTNDEMVEQLSKASATAGGFRSITPARNNLFSGAGRMQRGGADFALRVQI